MEEQEEEEQDKEEREEQEEGEDQRKGHVAATVTAPLRPPTAPSGDIVVLRPATPTGETGHPPTPMLASVGQTPTVRGGPRTAPSLATARRQASMGQEG